VFFYKLLLGMVEENAIPWWEHYATISIDDVMVEDQVTQYKKLRCIILSMKKNEMKLLSIYSRSRGAGASNFMPSTTSYDRMFLFGCLGSRIGKCFVVICETSRKSVEFLRKIPGGNAIVGQTGFLMEPLYDGRYLTQNSNLPVFDVADPFVPVLFTAEFPCPLNFEMPMGETKFFNLYGVKVKFENARMMSANCTGIACDRLFLLGKATVCGCFQNKTKPALTLQGLVTVEGDRDFSLKQIKYRSWTLTELCLVVSVDAEVEQFSEENIFPFRTSISESINFINENGGWDICGWARKGVVVDASDQREGSAVRGSEEIGSDTVNPHIIKMVPHNTSTEVLADIQQRRYQIK
jgi:hypothetical protein